MADRSLAVQRQQLETTLFAARRDFSASKGRVALSRLMAARDQIRIFDIEHAEVVRDEEKNVLSVVKKGSTIHLVRRTGNTLEHFIGAYIDTPIGPVSLTRAIAFALSLRYDHETDTIVFVGGRANAIGSFANQLSFHLFGHSSGLACRFHDEALPWE